MALNSERTFKNCFSNEKWKSHRIWNELENSEPTTNWWIFLKFHYSKLNLELSELRKFVVKNRNSNLPKLKFRTPYIRIFYCTIFLSIFRPLWIIIWVEKLIIIQILPSTKKLICLLQVATKWHFQIRCHPPWQWCLQGRLKIITINRSGTYLFNLKIRQNFIKVINTKQILDICLFYIYAYNDKIGPEFFENLVIT